jgi:hypothetical protein
VTPIREVVDASLAAVSALDRDRISNKPEYTLLTPAARISSAYFSVSSAISSAMSLWNFAEGIEIG